MFDQTRLIRPLRWAAGFSFFALCMPTTEAQEGAWLGINTTPFVSVGFDADHGHWTSDRPDSHAPIGVMGDHVHSKGGWMFSMRYMLMRMNGSRDGTHRLSDSQVLGQGYMVTPTSMDMEMLMFGAMYAPEDWVTLMAMVPYVRKKMSHLTGMGGTFETESEGLGDIRLSGLFPVWRGDHGGLVHLEGGLSLPTGSTSERDATPMSASAKLPYPMQLGSGTTDVVLGATAQRQQDWGSYGAQARGLFRLGENGEDYTLGDVHELTTWAAHRIADDASASLRLAYVQWDDIRGADPELNAAVVPTADPGLRAGQRLDVGLGVNGRLGSARLAAEVLLPLWQDLDGPQLETDLTLVLGLQLSL
ncbi:transporter [Engelhardtia mirabilis]|uniref:Transporter n=1 Tax=Engelhardtia mirabilis TaxID=2528011 RepID=A0A518BLX3_9BACT|nr:hypothetical protein Pla133_30660 [Planctomycetes bacterium Pla133]QDV02301.1 hypothetical protein Pla86_30650 [Planctomycetes bacterium Pla86]